MTKKQILAGVAILAFGIALGILVRPSQGPSSGGSSVVSIGDKEDVPTKKFFWNTTMSSFSFRYPEELDGSPLIVTQENLNTDTGIVERVSGSLLNVDHIRFNTNEAGFKTPLQAIVVETDTKDTAEGVMRSVLAGSIQNPDVYKIQSRKSVVIGSASQKVDMFTMTGGPAGIEAVPGQSGSYTEGTGWLIPFGVEGQVSQYLFIYIDKTYAGDQYDLLKDTVLADLETGMSESFLEKFLP